MKAARIREYGKPAVLEDVPMPTIEPDEILVQVKACGACRSDAQLIDGYFRPFADIPTPITIGHEISGAVFKIGRNVPKITEAIAAEPATAVGQKDVDAIIDCAGAAEMMDLAFSLLAISGHYADVGLVGEGISVPLLPRTNREQTLDRMRAGEIVGRVAMTW